MTGISFIVSVYNKARFLPGVLDAIAAQAGDFERELIVVDDGSIDDSLALCRNFASETENVTVITQPNAGPAVATNKGAALARHEWIKAVDGDDVLAPWCTQRLLEAALGQGADVAFGAMTEYGLATGSPFLATAPEDAEAVLRRDALDWVLYKPQFNLSQTLIRRDAFLSVGGCDEGVFVQDYSIVLRLAHHGPFAQIDTPVCAAPLAEEGRLSGDVSRMLADTNRALFHFVRDTKGLGLAHRWFAARRAAGRAWKWQHRHRSASVFSRHYMRFLGSYLPVPALWTPMLEGAAAAIIPD
jgi:glycosyltransferase involved in cell wall biosynthesis